MAKGGKSRKRDNNKNPNKKTNHDYAYAAGDDDMMDDEIDAFHKQRDVVPLDVNEDIGESDEDNEHPVFDFEDAKDEDEDDDEDMEDDTELTGLAAKIARQQKYLRAKIGGVEDDMHNDAEDEEEKRAVWGRRKNIYYSADNVDYELQSSDEELPAEEEAEVLRLQKEKAKSLSMEDFGLEDVIQDESDREPTLEEILVKGKIESKVSADQKAQIDSDTVYEEVEKDLNALSRDEQMDVVYSSAPELVGLLSELNDALEQLENKVNPLLSKVRERREDRVKEGMHYMEVKQLLLMAYCQAITFYLLLKSEGQSVRDHPVIARLVEIKNLLEKMKQLDENLPSELEEILNTKDETEKEVKEVKLVKENDLLLSTSVTKGHRHSLASAEAQEAAVPHEASELVKVDFLKDNKNRGGKHKRQNDEVGIQSMEMLKVRAALEEKLKQKGIFSSIAPKHDKAQKHLQPVNGQLESFDDFDDDAIDVDGGIRGTSNGHSSLLRLSKLSQIATSKLNKPKFVSGDDDLPKRDDIGERRRKHELRVLAGAGIKSSDDFEDEPGFDLGDGDNVDDMEEDVGNEESEDEFYKQVKEQRDAKLAAKAEMYSRNLAVPLASIPETVVDGKRHISYQMEKNRGLTRARKKLTKNPRKKYKLQHQKAVKRRQGQVREIKRPSGPYGGEASGINAGISRSIRLK